MQDNDAEVRQGNEFIAQNLTRMRGIALAELRAVRFPDPESHVDDVVSETCITIRVHWRQINSPEDALYKITAYRARSFAREHRREFAGEIGEEAIPLFHNPGRDPEEISTQADLIERLLPILNEEQQTVIIMRFFHELSFDAIAVVLGKPPGTVRSTYSRAIRKLRDAILLPAIATGSDASHDSGGKSSRGKDL